MLFAIALGAFIGWFNGMLTAYAGIPAFIVTLGGLIAYSGIAWAVIRGETVAPMDKTFKLIGGNGPLASIGPFWSWVLAVVACAGIIAGAAQRPAAAQALQVSAAAGLGRGAAGGRAAACAVLGVDAGRQLLPLGAKVIEKYAKDNGIPIPPASKARTATRSAWPASSRPLRRAGWSSIRAMPSRF